MSIELIIFDCDGVLIDSEVLACQAVADILGQNGLSYDWRVIAERFTGINDHALAKVIEAETGASLPEDFAAIVARHAVSLFEDELEAITGIHDLIERLAIPFCVASNSETKRLARALEIVSLDRHFPLAHQFSADHVERPKPAGDLHLYAAAQMGFAAEKALVIEDSRTGVEGARAAGMEVIGFLGAAHPAATVQELEARGVSHCIASMAEMADHFGERGWLKR